MRFVVIFLQLISKRARWLVMGALVLIVIGLGLLIFNVKRIPASPFMADIRNSVSFPLYYPTKYPPGYQLDTASVSSNGQAVLYQLKSNSSRALTIFVSIQAKPTGMNLDDFYSKHLTEPTSHITANGPVVVGLDSQGVFGGLATDKDWVIVTTADEAASSKVLTTLNSLRKTTE